MMAAGYQAGRSLRTIADELGVHHRTVAARLDDQFQGLRVRV